MRRILKHFLVSTFSLYIISRSSTGLVFENGVETLFYAGAALTLASILAKPIINLLLLPINLISFGLFRWLSYGVVLYIVTLVVDQFKVTGFSFAGFTSNWFDVPAVSVGGFPSFIIYAFLIAFLSSTLYWILK
jgi:uncharacterized membrane protein YvlD (DUF360 family)